MNDWDLLCFDPGKTTGWAWFIEGELMHANFEDFDELICRLPFPQKLGPTVLIEKPQWRPHERKIDINDLISLAVMVGEIKRTYRSHVIANVDLILPTTWKGSVPKEIHNQRVLKHLTAEEFKRLPVSKRAKKPNHNMVDAVGLGLWKLGRLR